MLGDRRQVEDVPFLGGIAGFLGQQTADHVLVVPAGEHDHLGREVVLKRAITGIGELGFGAGEPNGLEPVLDPRSHPSRASIGWALVGVIDHTEAVALAGERPIHTSSDAAAALGGEPVSDRRGILREQVAGDAIEVARPAAGGRCGGD